MENHEKAIEEAFYNMTRAAFGDEGVESATSDDLSNFRRAETADYLAEIGKNTPPSVGEIADYLTAKYPTVSRTAKPVEESTELVIRIGGGVIKNTLPEFKKFWFARIGLVNLSPKTDNEFVGLDDFCKKCKVAEQTAQSVLDDAMSGSVEIAKLFDDVKLVISKIRSTRLSGEKAISERKEVIKKAEILKAEQLVKDHISTLRVKHPCLDGVPLCEGLSPVTEAAKGKKKIATLASAVNSAAELLKSAADEKAEHYIAMLELMGKCKFEELFPDRRELCQKDKDVVVAEISARSANRELAEKKRADAAQEKADEAKAKAAADTLAKPKTEAKAAVVEPSRGLAGGFPGSTGVVKKYSFAELKEEARLITNGIHLRNWRAKHGPRIDRNLLPPEVVILDKYIDSLLDDFHGTPPPSEEAPVEQVTTEVVQDSGTDELPEEFGLRIKCRPCCTGSQLKAFASEIRAFLELNPHVEPDTIEIVRIEV